MGLPQHSKQGCGSAESTLLFFHPHASAALGSAIGKGRMLSDVTLLLRREKQPPQHRKSRGGRRTTAPGRHGARCLLLWGPGLLEIQCRGAGVDPCPSCRPGASCSIPQAASGSSRRDVAPRRMGRASRSSPAQGWAKRCTAWRDSPGRCPLPAPHPRSRLVTPSPKSPTASPCPAPPQPRTSHSRTHNPSAPIPLPTPRRPPRTPHPRTPQARTTPQPHPPSPASPRARYPAGPRSPSAR